MPDTTKIAPGVAGVAFTPPPMGLLADATRIVEAMAQQLPAGHGTLLVDIKSNKGWNAAVAHKVNDHWVVGAWIGKDWGQSLTGAAIVRGSW